jgi:hypothetical protein
MGTTGFWNRVLSQRPCVPRNISTTIESDQDTRLAGEGKRLFAFNPGRYRQVNDIPLHQHGPERVARRIDAGAGCR